MPPIVHGDYKMIPSLWYKMSTPTYQLLTIKSQILISASIVTHYPKIQNHQTFYQPFFIKNQYFWKTSHKKMFLFSFLITEFKYSLFLFSKVCIKQSSDQMRRVVPVQTKPHISISIDNNPIPIQFLKPKQNQKWSKSSNFVPNVFRVNQHFGKLVRRKCFCFHF